MIVTKSKDISIHKSEQPYTLPKNWVWYNLDGILLELKNGTTVKQSKSGVGEKVSRIESVQNNRIDFSRVGYIVDATKIKETDYYQEGDLTLSHINSFEHVGKTALIDKSCLPLVHGMNLLRLRCNQDIISPSYFFLFSQSVYFRNQVKDKVNRSVNQVSINQKKLKEVLIPVPPLETQKLIVAKLESMLGKINEARELISEAKESFQNRRAAILAKAFRGELTTKWREQNPEISSGSELLDSIKKNKSIKSKKNNTSDQIDHTDIPFDLPSNWKWVKLYEVSEFINGDRGKNYPNRSEYVESGIPWINTGHIEEDGSLSMERMNYITREKFDILGSGKIKKGDIVYCLRGATFGKTAMIQSFNEGAIASSLMIIRPASKINLNFLYWYLVSPLGKSQLFRFDNGTAQPNLSAKSVREYLLPLPPQKEQSQIANLLQRLFDVENKNKELSEIEIETIEKSILNMTFKGELIH